MSLIKKTSNKRVKGIASLSVLLVVMVVVLIISALTPLSKYSIKNTERFLNFIQANQYVKGLESLAMQQIADSFNEAEEKQKEIIHHRNDKLFKEKTFEINTAQIRYKINDLQSKYNINNLSSYQDDHSLFYTVTSKIESGETIANQIIDWIDENDESLEKGAEDTFYNLLKEPFFTANQKLISMDELLYLPSVNRKNLTILKKYFTVLPSYSNVNINTAVPKILNIFAEAGADTNKLKGKIDSKLLYETLGPETIFSISSNYFLFKCEVKFQDYSFYYNSYLKSSLGENNKFEVKVSRKNFLKNFVTSL